MVLKRRNIEKTTSDRIEAAIMQAAGYKVVKAGGLNNRQLEDVSNSELKALSAMHDLFNYGRFVDPNSVIAKIAPILKTL